MRRFLYLAPMVGFGLVFAWRPAAIQYLGYGLAFFVMAAFALILGAYAFVYAAPRRAKRAGFTLSDASFVGFDEGNTRLRLIEEGGAACRVEMTRGYYAISVAALAAGGPGLLALLLCNARMEPFRNPMTAFAIVFAVSLSALLARTLYVYLFRRPSLRMSQGIVAFFRGGAEVRRFGAKDLRELRVDPHVYVDSDGNQMRSSILVARLSDGAEKRLLASRSQEEVDRIAARMRLLMGMR